MSAGKCLQRRWPSRGWFCPLVVGTVFLAFFCRAFFLGEIFSFRDAGHFYFPLFGYVRQCLHQGILPLWNPLENLGQPLAAGATASAFYPPAWLMLLPFDFGLLFRVYVLIHAAWGTWGMFRFARTLRCRKAAATLGAVAYMFAGPVVFQTSNIVFLVGAAWLPWAADSLWRLRRQRSPGRIAWSACTLAMPILGGDPQITYHLGLLVGGFSLLGGLRRKRLGNAGVCGNRHPWRFLAACAIAAAAAAGLAAVQILPSSEYAQQSDRALIAREVSLWAMLTECRGQGGEPDDWSADGLLCRYGRPGSETAAIPYHFSVGWWRLPEYLWPNFGGKAFPVHRRWMDSLPGEGRLWCPSLYMGLIPLLLAGSVFSLHRRRRRVKLFSWVLVLSLLCAAGWYGLGWWLIECRVLPGDGTGPIGPPVGGLYWLLVTFLPGYAYFRYPAKWLTFAALALAALAALGCEALARRGPRRMRGPAVATAGLSVAALVLLLAGRKWLLVWLSDAQPHPLFGPLDPAGTWWTVFWGVLQTLVLSALVIVIAHFVRRRWPAGRSAHRPAVAAIQRWLSRQSGRAGLPGVLLVLTACDLILANGWLVVTHPPDGWQDAPVVREGLPPSRGAPPRVFRARQWYPGEWPDTPSRHRLSQWLRWEAATSMPKHNLRQHLAVLESHGTLMSADYRALLRLAHSEDAGAESGFPDRWFHELVGTDALLGPPGNVTSAVASDPIGVESSTGWQIEEFTVHDNAVAVARPAPRLPRTHLVHQVRWLPPAACKEGALDSRTAEVFFGDAGPLDPTREAIVECPYPQWREVFDTEALAVPHQSSGTGGHSPLAPSSATCSIVEYSPGRIVIEVDLPEPALLTVAEQYDPGWRARVTTLSWFRGPAPPGKAGARWLPVLRANRVLLGLWLPEGRQRVELSYRPRSMVIGGTTSVVCWLLLLGVGFAQAVRGRRPKRCTTPSGLATSGAR